MGNVWYKVLILFDGCAVWSRKNLLRRIKDERIIDQAISLGYINQCGKTDIGEPQYCITELGKKIRDQ